MEENKYFDSMMMIFNFLIKSNCIVPNEDAQVPEAVPPWRLHSKLRIVTHDQKHYNLPDAV